MPIRDIVPLVYTDQTDGKNSTTHNTADTTQHASFKQAKASGRHDFFFYVIFFG